MWPLSGGARIAVTVYAVRLRSSADRAPASGAGFAQVRFLSGAPSDRLTTDWQALASAEASLVPKHAQPPRCDRAAVLRLKT